MKYKRDFTLRRKTLYKSSSGNLLCESCENLERVFKELTMAELKLSILIVVAQLLFYITFTSSLPVPVPQRTNTGIPVAGLRPDPDGEFPWLPSEFQTWDPLDKRGLSMPESDSSFSGFFTRYLPLQQQFRYRT